MKSKTVDENFNDISRGQVARLVHSEISEMFASQEASIISRLVANFTAGKATNEMLRDGIAAIAAMHNIIGQLERQVKEGIRARDEAQAERYS